MYKIFIFLALFISISAGADSANVTDPLDDHDLTCEEMRAHPELFEEGIDLGSGSGSPNKVEYECKESIENLPFMQNLIKMAQAQYYCGTRYYAEWRYKAFMYIGIGMHPKYFEKNKWQHTYNKNEKLKDNFRAWALSNYFGYHQYAKYKIEAKKALPQLINHFQKNFSMSRQEAETYSNSVMNEFANLIFYNQFPAYYYINRNKIYDISPIADYMENDIVSFDKIKELVKTSSNADIEQALRVAFLTKKEPKIIDFLLDNFKYSDNGDESLLFFALDYPQYIKVLVDKGADVDYKNPDGETPLFYAIKNNSYELVKLLIENGADVNHTARVTNNCDDDTNSQTPFIAAAIAKSDIEILKLLVKNGADINYIGTIYLQNFPRSDLNALDIVFNNIRFSDNQTQIDKFEKQAEYLKSLGIRPLNISIYEDLASRYYSRNQTKKALEMYLLAIDIGSKYLNNYYTIGEIYQSMREYEKSKEYLGKVIAENTNIERSIFYKQAVNHYYLNEFSEAIDNLEKVRSFADKDM
ncbi:MAG: ankyrin repeat domain-containing protein, partial [Campylobacteraceae bacterium]|nr:ankyrin repeat domain-containing protein [Campylobacteraceae bacterium]